MLTGRKNSELQLRGHDAGLLPLRMCKRGNKNLLDFFFSSLFFLFGSSPEVATVGSIGGTAMGSKEA